MDLDDESRITEITLQPDGRIFVFGLSREVLAILQDLCPAEHPLLELSAENSDCEELIHE
jgi:hypothetical protein